MLGLQSQGFNTSKMHDIIQVLVVCTLCIARTGYWVLWKTSEFAITSLR